MLVFRQLFDPPSSTYTYLVADRASGEAILIDPVFEQARRDAALVRELDLRLVATLDTHVHADHVTGAWLLAQMTGSRIVIARSSGAEGADRYVAHGDRIDVGARHLAVRETPGHTNGCVTYVLDDASMAFTGDALLIRGTGRTDFQQGDAERLFASVREQILSLPDHCLLYPAHDYRGLTVTSVQEERRFNPRLGGEAHKEDFAGYMQHLGLAHPKQIAVAVPANLKCGRPEHGHVPAEAPAWAPLTYTFAGIWEIAPQAVTELQGPVQLVDVRQPDEYTGPLGHVRDAKLIPLGELAQRVGELDPDRPAVMICRSGARCRRRRR
jgi:sulfur dioxygenase